MTDSNMDMKPDVEIDKSQSFQDALTLEEDNAMGEIEVLNASGHVQELDRSFGLFSLCAVGIVSDNAWGAGAGSLVTSLYNGGPPGVLWEFILVACVFYGCIGACLAELASSIPSSANVYHWSSVTAGKYGRFTSYYAGYWNWLAWNFGVAFSSLTMANTVLAMYNVYHPGYESQRWQSFVVYFVMTWMDCLFVMFGQRWLPMLGNVSGFVCLGGAFVTIMVCAIMPAMRGESASNSFVWTEWQNNTGYSSNGFVFLAGTLNGAFAIGTPDGVCHLAEEIPDPKRNVPWGIVAQLTTGIATTLAVYVSLMYAISNLDDVFAGEIATLPLATIYLQATGSTAGAFGLLFVFFLDVSMTCPGAYIAAGRMLWTLGRDSATPFPEWFGRISPTYHNQLNATFFCGCFSTVFGLIYLGSPVAFSAFIDCFTIFTTFSYLAAILPHLLSGRRNIRPGPFWMSSFWAYLIGFIACSYIIVFNGIIYLFPFALPVDAASMNYSVLIVWGLSLLLLPWYFWIVYKKGYTGPRVLQEASDSITRASVDFGGNSLILTESRPSMRRKTFAQQEA